MSTAPKETEGDAGKMTKSRKRRMRRKQRKQQALLERELDELEELETMEHERRLCEMGLLPEGGDKEDDTGERPVTEKDKTQLQEEEDMSEEIAFKERPPPTKNDHPSDSALDSTMSKGMS